jgi:hypothetical protein
MLSPGPTPGHLAPTSSSTSGRSCAGLSHCAGSYIHTAKIIRGIPVVTSTLRPLVGASGLSTSASTPDSDSADDYPEIGVGACREHAKYNHFIYMVAPNGDRSSNNSNRYPTIRRSEASDARTSSGGLAHNMNPDFNIVWVQAIMETIQRMAPDGSPLAVLAQQGTEATNLSSLRSRPAFSGGNLLSVAMIGHDTWLSEHDVQWLMTRCLAA